MDTQINYQQIVKNILLDYAQFYKKGGINIHTLFDDNHKSYMLLEMGWHGNEYIHHAPIHMEIIDNEIWIQNDDTEEGVATDLLEAGISNQQIVLGFRHPSIRAYTEFATGNHKKHLS